MKAEIVTIWRTTPAKLREIADHLEKAGDRLMVDDQSTEFPADTGIVVRLDWHAYEYEKTRKVTE